MKSSEILGLVVLLNFGNGKIEQILLNPEEEMAILGFIKEIKKISGKNIEIINGATQYIKATTVENSKWLSIKKYMRNENERAEIYRRM